LGLLVFWQLSAGRQELEAEPQNGAIPDAPSYFEPAPLPAPDALIEPSEAQPSLDYPFFDGPPLPELAPTLSETEAIPLRARLSSPALVIDLSQAPGVGPTSNAQTPTIADLGASPASVQGVDAPFASASTPARAETLANQAYTIVEGAVISAVLETAINSDLPGYVRAIVSRDVRGFDGANVLIPQGSRLVGQYRSSAAIGQSRAFVIWTRDIRPDGVNVRLEAPGADTLGRGGLEGEVDRHFLQRFGGALLLSLINLGGALAVGDPQTQVVIGSTTSAANAATAQALQSDLSIAPTLEVPHGTSIRVFVTRDLDFSVLEASDVDDAE
jgi:type IV secretion system protein VirB10